MIDDKLLIIVISTILFGGFFCLMFDLKYIFLKTHPTILKLAEEIKKGNFNEIEDSNLIVINFKDYKIRYFFIIGRVELFKNEIKILINRKERNLLYKSIHFLFRLQESQSRSLLND